MFVCGLVILSGLLLADCLGLLFGIPVVTCSVCCDALGCLLCCFSLLFLCCCLQLVGILCLCWVFSLGTWLVCFALRCCGFVMNF